MLRGMSDAVACVAVLPTWLLYLLLRLLTGRFHACESIGQRAARWPGDFGNALRRALLRRILRHVGKNVVISFGSTISKDTSELGDHAYLGAYCVLGSVRVGKDTLIADHVCIPSGAAQHGTSRLDIPMWRQKGEFRTITIGEDCWIGSHSTIMADVGNHCIVGAGSVVTKPVPDYAIVAGNPAKQLGDRREVAAQATQEPPDADRSADDK
jgi:acetyltransferase-like isoleucine patch superfamily enzyme